MVLLGFSGPDVDYLAIMPIGSASHGELSTIGTDPSASQTAASTEPLDASRSAWGAFQDGAEPELPLATAPAAAAPTPRAVVSFAPDAVGLQLDIAKGERIKLTGPEPLRLIMQ